VRNISSTLSFEVLGFAAFAVFEIFRPGWETAAGVAAIFLPDCNWAFCVGFAAWPTRPKQVIPKVATISIIRLRTGVALKPTRRSLVINAYSFQFFLLPLVRNQYKNISQIANWKGKLYLRGKTFFQENEPFDF
jgi:hypothetical protein